LERTQISFFCAHQTYISLVSGDMSLSSLLRENYKLEIFEKKFEGLV
jgi:hypothetical protein